MERNLDFADELTDFMITEGLSSIVCFSHAASVALISGLLDQEIDEQFTFAPCGIYELNLTQNSKKWELVKHGSTNAPHVSKNSPGTFPWGFEHATLQMLNTIRKSRR